MIIQIKGAVHYAVQGDSSKSESLAKILKCKNSVKCYKARLMIDEWYCWFFSILLCFDLGTIRSDKFKELQSNLYHICVVL